MMPTRTLGRTGLLVSEIAFGAMTFGKESDEDTSHALLDRYADAGGNFIDTADVYQAGVAEEIIGRWLEVRRGARDYIVLATKCRFPMGEDPNQAGLSRRWIVRACEDSLRRLRTDCIDLYQAHAWDPITPIEESLAAFDDLVRAGKVRHIGVSNFTGWQLQRAILVARHAGLSPVVSLQPQYSLLAREVEWELLPLCAEEGLATIPWSPLAQGWLTGKYSPHQRPTGATRLGEDPNRGVEAYDRRNTERTWRIVDEVKQVAGEVGATPAQVALRWVADRRGITAPIIGARTVEQLDGSLGAADVKLDDDQRARLDEVSAPSIPDYPYGFLADAAASRLRDTDGG